MRGYLQYKGAGGAYKDVFTVRTKDKQEYTVKPLLEDDWADIPDTIGYLGEAVTQGLTLNTDFLDETDWYFRVVLPRSLQQIELGLQRYHISNDAELERATIRTQIVTVVFEIPVADYADFTVPESLPEGEGGIYIEDSGIYIE